MPRIQEYGSQVGAPGPVDTRRITGEDTGAGMGRAIQQIGNQVESVGSAVYKAAEQEEVSDATEKLSGVQARTTAKINDGITKGTLNAQEIMDAYNDEVGELSGNYSTRAAKNLFNKSSQTLRSGFQMSTIKAQAEINGIKAQDNFQKTQANITSGIMNDPSSFETAKEFQTAHLDALVSAGSLDFKTATKLKAESVKDLAKAAVRGWANLDPEEAKKQLNEGKWDKEFDGDVKKQMLSETETAITAKRVEQDRIKTEVKKAQEEAQKVTLNKMLPGITSGSLSTKEVLNSNLDPDKKHQVIGWIAASSKDAPTMKTNPAVFNDVFQRIHLPDGDPKKITNDEQLFSLVGKGLDIDSLNKLRKEQQGGNTEEGKARQKRAQALFKYAEAKLVKSNPMIGYKDADGEANYASWLSNYSKDLADGRAKGKTDHELFDPNSPDYLGKTIGAYTKTPQQIMKSNADTLRGGTKTEVPPEKMRKPGESVSEWKARTQK